MKKIQNKIKALFVFAVLMGLVGCGAAGMPNADGTSTVGDNPITGAEIVTGNAANTSKSDIMLGLPDGTPVTFSGQAN